MANAKRRPAAEQVPEWSLGDRLSKSRRHAHLSQAAMAALFGVSPSTIAKWESDERQPRRFYAQMKQWAEITRVPLAWLLGFGTERGLGPLTPQIRHLDIIAGGGKTTPPTPPIIQLAHQPAD